MFAVPEHTVLRVSPHRPSGIATLLRRAVADARPWQVQLDWHYDQPTRLSIPFAAAGVHVWLTGWPPGVRAVQQGAFQGAFTVVSGTIIEMAADSSRPLTAGRVRVFGPDYRHLLSNPLDEPAVTVHVELRATSAVLAFTRDARAVPRA